MAPVHLLTGDDDLLLQRGLSDLLARLTAEDDALEVEVHDAVELEGLPSLRTTSLFGERVGVAIRGLEDVRANLKGEIEEYLEAPDPDAVLVLVARGVGKIRKIATRSREVGEVHEHVLPKSWADREWDALVRDEFRRLDRKATADGIAAIRRHAGTEPAAIASQVAQVVAATPGDAAITGDHVDELIGAHGRESSFVLVDAIVDRDVEAALTALRGLLEAGDEPVMIAGALVYRFRSLLVIRGGGDHSRASVSKGQHNRLKPLASRNFSAGELGWCMDRLARLDVELKGGSALDPGLALELAVIDLATPRAVGRPFNPVA